MKGDKNVKKLSKGLIYFVVIILIGLWLLTGVYTITSDGGEQAVVTRFGEFVRTEKQAGLKWHLPTPIEKISLIRSEELRSLEFGYMTSKQGSPSSNSTYIDRPSQSLMLTKDEDLVNIETVVQYKIMDVEAYLFNVDSPYETLEIAAESAIRRVVANHDLDDVLTIHKSVIQTEIENDLQEICDSYEIGIDIKSVILQSVYAPNEVDEAFKDVVSAREDMNRFINEAEKYANEIIPNANGNAAEIVNKANAYKEKRIAEAKGDVANFVQVLEKYEMGKDVTRTRMFLETIEEVLPQVKKYIMPEDGSTLKFLPLDDMNKTEGGNK